MSKNNVPGKALPNGEGFPLAVTAKQSDGTVSVNVDLIHAEAPSRKFVADAWLIERKSDIFHVIFLQHRLDGKGVRALVDVQMTLYSFKQFSDTINSVVFPAEFAKASPAKMVDEEPAQSVALVATFARASAGAGGGCIDFYSASPFAMQAYPKTREFRITGEVRVLLALSVFGGLLHDIQHLASNLAAKDLAEVWK